MNRIIKTGVGKKSRRDDILLTVGKTYGQEITSLLKVPHGTTQIPYGRNDGKTSHVIDRTCPVRDKILVEKRETATTQRPVRDVTCQKTLLPTARFFAREKSVSTNMSSLTGLKPNGIKTLFLPHSNNKTTSVAMDYAIHTTSLPYFLEKNHP